MFLPHKLGLYPARHMRTQIFWNREAPAPPPSKWWECLISFDMRRQQETPPGCKTRTSISGTVGLHGQRSQRAETKAHWLSSGINIRWENIKGCRWGRISINFLGGHLGQGQVFLGFETSIHSAFAEVFNTLELVLVTTQMLYFMGILCDGTTQSRA